jgi:Tfp pilus assembly protein PilP
MIWRFKFLVCLIGAANAHADAGPVPAGPSSSAPAASVARATAPGAAGDLTPSPLRAESIPAAERFTKMRDPFVLPDGAQPVVNGVPKSDLERFPVDQFKLVGVITGPTRLRALLLSPEGKSFFVAENMKIGIKNGSIRKITTAMVVVREKVMNVIGQEENVDSEIRLAPDTKVGAVDSQSGAAGLSGASVPPTRMAR